MIVAAAQISLAGMNPLKFLKTKDPFERATMQAVAGAALELERRREHSRAEFLAAEIIKRLSVALVRK
jgi:hypothetical protein